MLNYLTQNALLIAIILLLLVTNVWYFFELESKKGRIECDATYISMMEQRVIELCNELFAIQMKSARDFMQEPVPVSKPNLREIVSYDCQFKLNEVIIYRGTAYQVSKAEYLADPQTKIEQLHYHLTDELGNVTIRSHHSMPKDAIIYAFKKK